MKEKINGSKQERRHFKQGDNNIKLVSSKVTSHIGDFLSV